MTATEAILLAALAALVGGLAGMRLTYKAATYWQSLAAHLHTEAAAHAHESLAARHEAQAIMEAASALLAAYQTWAALHGQGDDADLFLAAEVTALRNTLAATLGLPAE